MIPLIRWLERSFPERPDASQFPAIADRLRGASIRLENKIQGIAPEIMVRRAGDDWSAQEHIGHLLDLEVLWRTRLGQLIAGEAELVEADMSNRRTYDAKHNDADLDHILALFRESRKSMASQLDELTEKQVVATALHPRLKQPMRLIDLCHFIAEHDDHHLAIIHELLRDAH